MQGLMLPASARRLRNRHQDLANVVRRLSTRPIALHPAEHYQQHGFIAANTLNLRQFLYVFALPNQAASGNLIRQRTEVRMSQGVDRDFSVQLTGRRLTTAEVLYYMPDNPNLLQSFLWQTLDQAPDFPRIHQFLDFWRREIDAVIHSVSVGGAPLIGPAKLRPVQYWGQLN
jgi:uncharacterized protein Usg